MARAALHSYEGAYVLRGNTSLSLDESCLEVLGGLPASRDTGSFLYHVRRQGNLLLSARRGGRIRIRASFF